ncbi:uncharacterized protein [Amphiura filiformis]|uniref:uncharacterized protein n=1 Tax=Amphiura filiformis TaxID=82378 RepID=UPI003B20CA72
MSEFFAQNQAKLSLAAATAVNKVLKCHSTESSGQTMSKTRQESVGQAIQNINQSISTIVSYSVHDEFRQACFSLLQVDNSIELSKTVQCKLWTIAKNRLGVNVPEEYQEASVSQELMTQSQQDTESQNTASSSTFHPHARNHQSNSYLKEDSAIYNLSPERYSQRPCQFYDDDGNTSTAADFANLDVFPETDEQWLESIQREPEGTDGNDDHSQNTHESAQSEQIMKTTMGDDWFEEVLLNCDWKKQEF